MGVGGSVQRGVRVFEAAFEVDLVAGKLQPGGEHGSFIGGFFVALDFAQALTHAGFVDFVEACKGSLFAAVLLFELGELGGHAVQRGS